MNYVDSILFNTCKAWSHITEKSSFGTRVQNFMYISEDDEKKMFQ